LEGHIAFKSEQASPTFEANANPNTSSGLQFEASYSEVKLFQYIGTFITRPWFKFANARPSTVYVGAASTATFETQSVDLVIEGDDCGYSAEV
jgi:hypothetical protein